MKQTEKIILLTVGGLVLAGAVYAATRKKKTSKTGKVIVDDVGIGPVDSQSTLKVGSPDEQNVIRLQEVINELHRSASYINNNCGGMKWGYMQGSLSNGNIVSENGVFDQKTAKAAQYYLNRQEVDLDYLKLIRDKIAKQKKGDKCIYPMAVVL